MINDTSLELKNPGVKEYFDENTEYSYNVVPKLDQTHVYESVISRLITHNSIGIFPEGGSHDRTDLLPIKAGVSIMALGAMAKDPKCRISIVACGLKYFKPQKFRSKVIIEFSRPYRIPTELVLKFKKNKRDACGEVLKEVEAKMRDVTLQAPSYNELKKIYIARDLYMPRDESAYKPGEINEIYKRFCKGFNSFRDKPELKELLEEIDVYMKELNTFGVKDDQVKTMKINFFKIMLNFLYSIPFVLVNLLFVKYH